MWFRLRVLLLSAPLLVACVPSPTDVDPARLSPEGRAVWAQRDALKEQLGVELRSATLLDGVNLNVLKLDVRSKDQTLEDRTRTAVTLARYLMERKLLPAEHHRVVIDFPVTFQVGCMPVNLFERVQVATRTLAVLQALPAKRVLGYDQFIRGHLGQVILDDSVWNIPFFVTVDRVELAREVMGVTAKPDEVFVSVHAWWTNIGVTTATMGDDPWRLVEGPGPRQGEMVAILDGGETHLARNGGKVKMEPVEPAQTRERWYVYRVPAERLKGGSLVFARQRYAKQTVDQKTWQKAGFEVWVPIKNGQPCGVLPEPGKPLLVRGEEWQAPELAPQPTTAVSPAPQPAPDRP